MVRQGFLPDDYTTEHIAPASPKNYMQKKLILKLGVFGGGRGMGTQKRNITRSEAAVKGQVQQT